MISCHYLDRDKYIATQPGKKQAYALHDELVQSISALQKVNSGRCLNIFISEHMLVEYEYITEMVKIGIAIVLTM